MLFVYKPLPKHQINKMHEYISFIFEDVWCEARDKEYVIEELFNDNEELKQIVTGLHYSERQGADFFLKELESIFHQFATLSFHEIYLFQLWFKANNDIENLCNQSEGMLPVTYGTVKELYPDLAKSLNSFYTNLYSKSFLGLKAVKDKIGALKIHFNDFNVINSKGKCPFCGISNMKSKNYKGHDSYDHYLPKGTYPFNSINFKNLAPTCHECNSGYKSVTDPLSYNTKVFYPFSETGHELQISLALKSSNWQDLEPKDVELEIGPKELKDQITAWKDIYGIEERYKALCCAENDGQFWITQVFDECQNDGKTPLEMYDTLKRQATNSPFAQNNFLKKPFVEACHQAGLFDAISF